MDTTVERSSPKASLCVAGDGIDKAVIHPLIAINQPFPLARFWIETDNPVVTANADRIIIALKQSVNMVSYLCERRRKHLLQTPVSMHQQQSLLPGSQPHTSVAGL